MRRYGNDEGGLLLPENRKRTGRASKLLIAAGILMLLAASAIVGYSFIDDHMAGQRAQAVLAQMRVDVAMPVIASSPTPYAAAVPMVSPPPALDVTAEPEPSPPYTETLNPTETPVPDDPVAPKPQYETAGILTIPKLALELPVLSEYSDSNLNVSICRYVPEPPESRNRLVIAGHNYKSHFGRLAQLVAGDAVCFENGVGELSNYTVTEITNISMYDHDALKQGEWDITLFTCDSDRSKRILVRCVESSL